MLLGREEIVRSESAGGSGNAAEEVLEALVQAELQQSCYHAIRCVTCRLQGGVLTLRGQVSSYYYKQMAQVAAQRCLAGAARVRNRLNVVPVAA